MDLKETKQLPTSQEINAVNRSKRNNSDDQKIYDILFPGEEVLAGSEADNKFSLNYDKERKFGNVSTLDWLQTWRSTQISYPFSSDPGK